jgi:hypothetical protein
MGRVSGELSDSPARLLSVKSTQHLRESTEIFARDARFFLGKFRIGNLKRQLAEKGNRLPTEKQDY